MTGKREETTGFWTVDLTKLTHKRIQLINNLPKNRSSSAQELIELLHAACFSPPKSTLIKAIKNQNFVTWPGLTSESVEKYLATSKCSSYGTFGPKTSKYKFYQTSPEFEPSVSDTPHTQKKRIICRDSLSRTN